MLLTAAERGEVVGVLSAHGIEGPDLETGLATVCSRAEVVYSTWLAGIGSYTFDDVVARYGHDAARHVWVLARHSEAAVN